MLSCLVAATALEVRTGCYNANLQLTVAIVSVVPPPGPYVYNGHVTLLDTRDNRAIVPPTTGQAPSKRAQHTATLVGNMMVVYGGSNGLKVCNDVHSLDLGTPAGSMPSQWSLCTHPLPPSPLQRRGSGRVSPPLLPVARKCQGASLVLFLVPFESRQRVLQLCLLATDCSC